MMRFSSASHKLHDATTAAMRGSSALASSLLASAPVAATKALSLTRCSTLQHCNRKASARTHRTLTTSAIVCSTNNRSLSLSPPTQQPQQHSSGTRSIITRLLQNIGSKREVEQYLKFYSEVDTPKFAVIKVGGGILEDEMETLASSLSFLREVGLMPVVLHGAGSVVAECALSLCACAHEHCGCSIAV